MKKILIIFYTLFFVILYSCAKTPPTKKLVGIGINSLPIKLEYTIDEALNLDGLTVHAIYDDNSFEIINDFDVNYTSFNLGKNIVKIKAKSRPISARATQTNAELRDKCKKMTLYN